MAINFDTNSTTIQNALDRLQAGDAGARNALIVHCQERLRVLVEQMLCGFPKVRDVTRSSDVLQNVNIRLYRALEKVVLATPKDFLCLASWHIRNELIGLTRRHPEPTLDPPDTPDSTADNAETLACWTEFHEYVGALPETKRDFFDLLYYQGLTLEQTAKLRGIPTSTLRKQWAALRCEIGARFADVFGLEQAKTA
jgi:RNA polymerase sigma factor (sigma-70 family)